MGEKYAAWVKGTRHEVHEDDFKAREQFIRDMPVCVHVKKSDRGAILLYAFNRIEYYVRYEDKDGNVVADPETWEAIEKANGYNRKNEASK